MKNQRPPFKEILRLNSRAFIFLLFVFFSMTSKAAVSSYTFASSSGTYTPISGTVVISGTWDDQVSALISIPFAFSFNNQSFSSVGISANGFITLGAVPSGTIYCGLQNSGANSIAGYGTDLVNSGISSNIQYTTLGVSPNRQFIVQWTNCKHFGGPAGDLWNFQIILNEFDNSVQVVWGTSTVASTMGANACADAATESGNVGLRGNSATDFNLRSVTNGTTTWATSAAGGALNAVCNMSPTNIPPSGITYTWTPPPPSPMIYSSSTTSFLNNGLGILRNSINNPIIQIQVSVTGNIAPIAITTLDLNTTGCTNAATDLSSAKVFFTGSNGTFSTATQFGSTVVNPNGGYTVNGSATLTEGTNFFWITYDITGTATYGNNVKGCCTMVTGSGSMGTKTPTLTCPAGAQIIANPGTWTPVSTLAPHANLGGMLLLSDGTVIGHSNGGGGSGKIYDKLTPNASGSYINGTWSSIAPMFNDRLFFSSQVLTDGRVYVAGGEYGAGLTHGEVYNPLTNSWTLTPDPVGNISDANSEILPDGKVLQALVTGNLKPTKIYDPLTNTFAAGPSTLGIHNESVWIKLPDNSILFVDRLSTNSERYIPATNTWVADATVPVALYDSFGDETGAAVLLPDGRAFFIGSIGFTAFYTPSGNASPGTWAAGPTLPNSQGAPDAPAAMMANGKVLLAVGNVPTSSGNIFSPPTSFYEFDYLTNNYTRIPAPPGGLTLNIGCFQTCFLNLPDGTILYGQNQSGTSSQYYVYTPSGSPTASGKPNVGAIIQLGCDSFKITGTQFNGISQGSSYGDDWQMNTNYPVIRLTSGSNVYYCRSFNWNSTGVARGSAPDTAYFKLPAGLPVGSYSLVVTANGIASDPVTFNPFVTPVITGASSFCSGNSSVLDAGTYTNYLWSTTSTSETISVNTAGTYTVTVTNALGCTGSATVVVVVNPNPAPPISGGNVIACTNTLPATLVDIVPNGINVNWWDAATGGTLLLANSATYSTSTAGTYYNEAVDPLTGCISVNRTAVTLTINSNPAPPVSGGNVTLCASALPATLVDIVPNGINVNWWDASSGGNLLLPNSTTYITSTPGTYYNEAVDPLTGCISLTRTAVNLTVNQNPTPIVSGSLTFCTGDSTILDAGAGYSGYNWSTSALSQTISVNTAGTFTVNVTDGNGCTGSAMAATSTTVCCNVTCTGTITHVVCHGGITGAIDVSSSNATGTATYLWNNGTTTEDRTNLSAGTYTVTVDYGSGCTQSQTFLITQPASLTINGTVTHVTCKNTSTGAITLTPSGANPPYSFLWNNGSTVQNRIGLAAGTYTVTVNDAGLCGTKTATFSITQSSTNLLLNTNKTNVRCYGLSTGKASVAPSGGSLPYSYTWNTIPTQTTASISGLTAGVYTCVITDGYNCSKTAVITITEPAVLNVIQSQTPVTVNGGNDGTASVSVSGGTAPYTYLWNTIPSSTNVSVTGLVAGTYKCTVTDSKGCIKKVTFTISQPVVRGIHLTLNKTEPTLMLYPNPSSGLFLMNITGVSDHQKLNIRVTDFSGRMVFSEQITQVSDEQNLIDLTNLSKGVYFLSIKSESGLFFRKLVIQ